MKKINVNKLLRECGEKISADKNWENLHCVVDLERTLCSNLEGIVNTKDFTKAWLAWLMAGDILKNTIAPNYIENKLLCTVYRKFGEVLTSLSSFEDDSKNVMKVINNSIAYLKEEAAIKIANAYMKGILDTQKQSKSGYNKQIEDAKVYAELKISNPWLNGIDNKYLQYLKSVIQD